MDLVVLTGIKLFVCVTGKVIVEFTIDPFVEVVVRLLDVVGNDMLWPE